MKILQRIAFILFWEAILFLFLFTFKQEYYLYWLIFCLIALFFLIVISLKIIPTKKAEKIWQILFQEYQKKIKNSESYQSKATLLPFSCPACQYSSHYWEFLNEGKCPKCDSRLWSTVVNEKGQEYYELFSFHQDLERFLNQLSFRQKKKLRKMLYLGIDEKN